MRGYSATCGAGPEAGIRVRCNLARVGSIWVEHASSTNTFPADSDSLQLLVGQSVWREWPLSASYYFLSLWYDSSPTIGAEGRTIVTANGRAPAVRVLDDETRLQLIVRWDDPGRKVTSANIQAAREAERRRALEDGEVSKFKEANLSPKRPAADVFPAVSSVRAGVDGTVGGVSPPETRRRPPACG